MAREEARRAALARHAAALRPGAGEASAPSELEVAVRGLERELCHLRRGLAAAASSA